jgi:hypothetical protein
MRTRQAADASLAPAAVSEKQSRPLKRSDTIASVAEMTQETLDMNHPMAKRWGSAGAGQCCQVLPVVPGC